jgi:hypothetical protein
MTAAHKQAPPSRKRHRGHTDFTITMSEATETMPRYRQLFSAFIHKPAIMKASDIIGKTLLRPNPLLFGAVASFAFTLVAYLLSKNLGYRLSGSESIMAFLSGWIVGIVFDVCLAIFKKR